MQSQRERLSQAECKFGNGEIRSFHILHPWYSPHEMHSFPFDRGIFPGAHWLLPQVQNFSIGLRTCFGAEVLVFVPQMFCLKLHTLNPLMLKQQIKPKTYSGSAPVGGNKA